ncbi:MAG: hypothetical protein R6V35_01375 [Candidatus Nanohaloarchaea archaeon]
MERIVKGLEATSKVISSTESLLGTLAEMEDDEKNKEDETQELIRGLKQGKITEDRLERLRQEEKVEVNEEDKMVQFLIQIVEGEGEAVQDLENIVDALNSEEQKADQSIQQVQNLITKIKEDPNFELSMETLEALFENSKNAADLILDEANEELQASNISQELAQELGFTAQEIIKAEKLEKEEQFEEGEVEELSQRINSQRLNEFIHELERHTARDEQQTEQGRKQLLNLIDEAEATEEELESETKHTYQEAEQLLNLLQEIDRMAENAGMANEQFQQNFGNLMDEVGKAEDETKEAVENEEDAEEMEENAGDDASQ